MLLETATFKLNLIARKNIIAISYYKNVGSVYGWIDYHYKSDNSFEDRKFKHYKDFPEELLPLRSEELTKLNMQELFNYVIAFCLIKEYPVNENT